jgi:hypothetical protein
MIVAPTDRDTAVSIELNADQTKVLGLIVKRPGVDIAMTTAPGQPVTVTKARKTYTVKGTAGDIKSAALTEVPFEVVLSCP